MGDSDEAKRARNDLQFECERVKKALQENDATEEPIHFSYQGNDLLIPPVTPDKFIEVCKDVLDKLKDHVD